MCVFDYVCLCLIQVLRVNDRYKRAGRFTLAKGELSTVDIGGMLQSLLHEHSIVVAPHRLTRRGPRGDASASKNVFCFVFCFVSFSFTETTRQSICCCSGMAAAY